MSDYYDINNAQNPYSGVYEGDQGRLNSTENPWGSQPGGMAPQPAPPQGGPQNYPSYPNQFGLGSGNPNGAGVGGATLSPGGASGPSFSQKPITVQAPDTTSRGMSPWSMIGEANARENPGSPSGQM